MALGQSQEQLLDVRLRLEYAHAKLQHIDTQRAAFLAREPFVVACRIEPVSEEKVWYIDQREAAPMQLRLMIGEFIHHVRASLDNLVWALACSNASGTPHSQTQFVVRNHPNEFVSDRSGRLRDLSPGVQDAIEKFQPYAIEVPAGEDHAVWMLNRFWNDDKHRAPLVAAQPQLQALDFRYLGPVTIPPNTPVTPRLYPMGDKGDFSVVGRMSRDHPGYGVPCEFQLGFDLAFDDSSAGKRRPLMPTLNQLLGVAIDVVRDVCTAADQTVLGWRLLTIEEVHA